jgi:putative FmdB family regulatory protein
MPLFEYDCLRCGARFELLILRGLEQQPACPQCGALEPVKVLSSFAVNSENTRSANLSSARRGMAKVNKEKRVAEAEAIQKAHDEHDHG